jgi:1-acyl-sn-glycerol-3-phosphate acyltransferase
MILARSLLFMVAFYAFSTICAIAMLPLLLCPRRWMILTMAAWSRGVILMLRLICGVRMEIRGRQFLPVGAGLIGAKHQCMFDTMGPLGVFSDSAYVMKRELLKVPVYGWFCVKAGMIPIDRDAGSKALRALIAHATARAAEGRQVVIFPEGTRTAPGAKGDYKPGVAALYRALDLPCTPLATNSGVHWPAHGFIRKPGVIVYEFLEPIPAGVPRAAFMRTLEERLESASLALLGE